MTGLSAGVCRRSDPVEGSTLTGRERGEEAFFVGDVVGHCGVDGGEPVIGAFDEQAPTVVGVESASVWPGVAAELGVDVAVAATHQ
jgi:hypothetical protein